MSAADRPTLAQLREVASADEWHESEPESLADPLRNVEWAVGEMFRAMDDGRYRYEPVHVRADLNYLRGEARRAAREVEALRGVVAAVRELADEWERVPNGFGLNGPMFRFAGERIRAVLDGAPTKAGTDA